MKDSPFKLTTEFEPAGDQPQAIERLTRGVLDGETDQVLMGVTVSRKTFSMAHVIANVGRSALVMAPNKTLAAAWALRSTSIPRWGLGRQLRPDCRSLNH